MIALRQAGDKPTTTHSDRKRSALSTVPDSDQDAVLGRLLSDIDALAPMIARLAPDIERGRRLPQELVSALKSARRPSTGSMGLSAGMS